MKMSPDTRGAPRDPSGERTQHARKARKAGAGSARRESEYRRKRK